MKERRVCDGLEWNGVDWLKVGWSGDIYASRVGSERRGLNGCPRGAFTIPGSNS